MEREFSLVTDDVLGHVMAVTIATVCKNEYRTLLSLSHFYSPLFLQRQLILPASSLIYQILFKNFSLTLFCNSSV